MLTWTYDHFYTCCFLFYHKNLVFKLLEISVGMDRLFLRVLFVILSVILALAQRHGLYSVYNIHLIRE